VLGSKCYDILKFGRHNTDDCALKQALSGKKIHSFEVIDKKLSGGKIPPALSRPIRIEGLTMS